MFCTRNWLGIRSLVVFTVAVVSLATCSPTNGSNAFSCYQCVTSSVEEKCSEDELKPCLTTADRCVTHITKSSTTPLKVKRECGLGPCSFESDVRMSVFGMDHCDLSKDDVFCLICCRESGCNNANASMLVVQLLLVLSFLAALFA